MTTWTVDAAGAFVDWTKPPYRSGGTYRLVLEGEDPSKLSTATISKRTRELSALISRGARRGERISAA